MRSIGGILTIYCMLATAVIQTVVQLILPGSKHVYTLPGRKHVYTLPGSKHVYTPPGSKHV